MPRIINCILLVWLASAAVTAPSSAQNPQQAAMLEAQKEAMARVAFLVGEWEGAGWMDMPQGRVEFQSSEIVESRLDGLALVVEGLHYANIPGEPEPRVVHHALAMITYDPTSERYRVNTQVHAGGTGTNKGYMSGDAFVWGMSFGNTQIRYTMGLDEQGRWHEIGERSTDGEAWTPFLEMTLTRK